MEVTINLRSERPVFLSGEKVSCSITFNNRSQGPENLAWSSAQIQCICQVAAPSQSAVSTDHSSAVSSTSLRVGGVDGASGNHEVASTPPKILFCDLNLGPGEVKTYEFEDSVPIGCPSTYHGRHFRYTYKVVVASQRVHRAISTLKLPIRVLSTPEVSLSAVGGNTHQESSNKPSITNPFASKSLGEDDEDETDFNGENEDENNMSLRSLENSLLHEERKKATYYDIRAAGSKKVGKLCLFKSSYRLGEDILGLFNFSDVDISCLQYAVSLVSQEKLPSVNPGDPPRAYIVSSKAVPKQSFQEFCFGYEETSFTLPVPLHLTPSFQAPASRSSDQETYFQLQWLLRFEFVIAKDPSSIKFQPFIDENGDVTSIGQEWNGPSQVGVETMTWNLPVTIQSTHPKHLTQAVQVATSAVVTI